MDLWMLAVDGRGLVTAGVVMPAARPRVDKEAAGGMMPKVAPIKPVGNGPEPTYLNADSHSYSGNYLVHVCVTLAHVPFMPTC